MGKEILTFGGIEIEKDKFHYKCILYHNINIFFLEDDDLWKNILFLQ